MYSARITAQAIVILGMVLGISGSMIAAPPPQAGLTTRAQGASGVEVLTRGPVHEAFAEQIQFGAVNSLVVPAAPPAPLRETPPEYIPRLNNVGWVPGYWGWDDDRRNFSWVSGGWRASPPGQRYIPGYWSKADNGYRWNSGFWFNAGARQVTYLPPLPAIGNIATGPIGAAPSRDHFWIPGNFEFRNGNYAWRQGYWGRGRDGYAWVPNHYVSTARGAIFVPGYWDLPMSGRGQLFAPVALAANVAAQANFVFSPTAAIRTDQLPLHLFARPGSGHYYFGDYYGQQYASRGWIPWYDYGMKMAANYGYDPMFTYNQWFYGKQGINYGTRLAGWHKYYLNHAHLRPARTLAAQVPVAAGAAATLTAATATTAALGVPLASLVSATPASFLRLNANQRQSFAASANQVRLIGDQRLRLEGVSVAGVNATGALNQTQALTSQVLNLPAIAPVSVPGLVPGVGGAVGGTVGGTVGGVLGGTGVGVPNVGLPGVQVPNLGLGGGGAEGDLNLGGEGGLLGGGGGGLLGGPPGDDSD